MIPSRVAVTTRRDGSSCVDLRMASGLTMTVELLDELAASDNLTAAYQDQAGKGVWWSDLQTELQFELETAEAAFDEIEAEIWERERARCAKHKIPVGVQDRTIRARRVLDKSWRAASIEVREARRNARIVANVVKAFDARREMLISLGAHVRHLRERGEGISTLEKGLAKRLRAQRDRREKGEDHG